MKYWTLAIVGICLIIIFGYVLIGVKNTSLKVSKKNILLPTSAQVAVKETDLSINRLRQQQYLGSELIIEKSLPDGLNYHQYIVSYLSYNLKIFALLTIPLTTQPNGGWPAILFDHGYIPPQEYQTAPAEGQYSAYVSILAQHGYVVLKPDYRGNGNSQGVPMQSYVSSGYIDDNMNALASLKKLSRVNPKKIGIWAHSMGGNIALHTLVMTSDIKAAVIWSGVVGTYPEILQWWQRRMSAHSIVGNDLDTYRLIMQMVQDNGTPDINITYWQDIDPNTYLQNISTPIQLDVGTGDTVVPPSFSTGLAQRLKKAGKSVSVYEYSGDDHNISQNFTVAMQHSISFFDLYLK